MNKSNTILGIVLVLVVSSVVYWLYSSKNKADQLPEEENADLIDASEEIRHKVPVNPRNAAEILAYHRGGSAVKLIERTGNWNASHRIAMNDKRIAFTADGAFKLN